jgi:glycine hydroxymethyltransferase
VEDRRGAPPVARHQSQPRLAGKRGGFVIVGLAGDGDTSSTLPVDDPMLLVIARGDGLRTATISCRPISRSVLNAGAGGRHRPLRNPQPCRRQSGCTVGAPAPETAAADPVASENYASLPVLLTMGTWLSDKYAEGTIGHRFYAGCQNVDTVETVAAEHCRELFGAPYAYVQPHSGIDANLVAYWAILNARIEAPALERLGAKTVNDLSDDDWEALRRTFNEQRVMGMSLDVGGHLTHGFRHNISGKMFHQKSYGTDPETQLIDYDRLLADARAFKPLIIVAGYSAYPRRVNFATMREIADDVGATLFVDMAHFAGLVAGKVFTGDEDPVPYAHVGASTTHKSLRGPRGGFVLATDDYAPSVDKGCPMVLGGPLSHIMAAKAVAFAEARTAEFRTYAVRVADNAKTLADGLLTRGVRLVTGGTDNHLVLIDTRDYGLTGRQAESALLDSGIVTNRNSVPSDPNGAWYTTGVRIGTPALTSRGFGADEFTVVANLIADVLEATSPTPLKSGAPGKAKYGVAAGVADRTRAAAAELLEANPLYPGLQL